MACAHFGLIPAAGASARFGDPLPKQYQRIGNRTLLEHAVRALASCQALHTLFVVLAPADRYFRTLDWEALPTEIIGLYCGGPSRAASVSNGLLAVQDAVDHEDWVLVHDAARPCLGKDELERLVAEVSDDDVGGLLAVPVTDSLKRAGAQGRADSSVSRDGLWRALTPQMFRYRLLVEALHVADHAQITDEAGAIEALGLKPRLVLGSAFNIKVTYPEDLVFAEAVLGARKEPR